MPLMTRGGARPVKVHTQFKREPINAGLTFMVIYSCFCACFCTSTSTQRRERERESEGETKRERKGGRRREREGALRGSEVVWTQEVQRGGWVHCEDTTSLIMPSQSTLLLTGSPCKAHLP